MVTQRSPVRGLCSNVTLLIEKVEVGTFAVQIEIGDLRGERYEDMEALVDTGATTTVIPAPSSEASESSRPGGRLSSTPVDSRLN